MIMSGLRRTSLFGVGQISGNDNMTQLLLPDLQRLATTWLEHSMTAMNIENNEKKDTIPLGETLGIDIAERLKSHFLANMPTQSFAWLNNGATAAAAAAAAAAAVANATANATETSTKTGKGLSKTTKRSPNQSGPKSPSQTNGSKPSVSCETCGKKLADPSSLYRHRKIHSGEKPHQCPFCTRRFIQRYHHVLFLEKKIWI